ncbi:MAG: endonuclease/exonuclease/phosphatase family protein [Lachnospiraceae bacterium]|nr:endonuclease/exonuclease/phosphatase family protein [Lachnospiraceae bacterium]
MSKLKSVLLKIGMIIGAFIMLALSYCMYVLVSYDRIEDGIRVGITAPLSSVSLEEAPRKEEMTIVSYNIGFGAYTPDYTFFMDGGKRSWAESKESVRKTVALAGETVLETDPDIVLFQEVDLDSTRSYHVNQVKMLCGEFPDYSGGFALNYDSPFLLYPFYEPHGASKAGLLTLSGYIIKDCYRRQLPVSDSLSKLVDLDRAYTVTRIPVSGGKELVVINLHLSAYGSSEKVREGQTNMLKAEMEKEYAAGNYVIAGGDFNHDLKLKEDMPSLYWAHYYDRDLLPEHFDFAMDLLSDDERESLGNTCRDAGVAYDEKNGYTVTVDGFIISDNIKCLSYENLQTGYEFSDHNPVVMKFELED